MNLEIKKKWIEALKSREYNQGENQLRIESTDKDGNDLESFCCLGVLCDIHRKEVNPDLRWKNSDPDNEDHLYINLRGDLPLEIANWAGLDDRNPRVIIKVPEKDIKNGYTGDNHSLAGLNDNRTHFSTIADLIEEQL